MRFPTPLSRVIDSSEPHASLLLHRCPAGAKIGTGTVNSGESGVLYFLSTRVRESCIGGWRFGPLGLGLVSFFRRFPMQPDRQGF